MNRKLRLLLILAALILFGSGVLRDSQDFIRTLQVLMQLSV